MQDLRGAEESCNLRLARGMGHSTIGKYPGILESRKTGPSRQPLQPSPSDNLASCPGRLQCYGIVLLYYIT